LWHSRCARSLRGRSFLRLLRPTSRSMCGAALCGIRDARAPCGDARFFASCDPSHRASTASLCGATLVDVDVWSQSATSRFDQRSVARIGARVGARDQGPSRRGLRASGPGTRHRLDADCAHRGRGRKSFGFGADHAVGSWWQWTSHLDVGRGAPSSPSASGLRPAWNCASRTCGSGIARTPLASTRCIAVSHYSTRAHCNAPRAPSLTLPSNPFVRVGRVHGMVVAHARV